MDFLLGAAVTTNVLLGLGNVTAALSEEGGERRWELAMTYFIIAVALVSKGLSG